MGVLNRAVPEGLTVLVNASTVLVNAASDRGVEIVDVRVVKKLDG